LPVSLLDNLRRPGLAALVAAPILFASGCGTSEGEAEVTFWQFWPSRHIVPLLRRFEDLHPGVKVKMQQLTWGSGFEKIVAATAAGRPPDLCELGSTWVARFASEGVLEDVTDVTRAFRDRYRMWAIATYEGRVYGWPWLLGTRVLFYNKELFRRAGLGPERPPETWTELLEAARRVDQLGPGVRGFGMNAGERYVAYKKFMALAWATAGASSPPTAPGRYSTRRRTWKLSGST